MKLSKYLENQVQKMPEVDKILTYEKIRNQIEKESIFSKISFYIKVGVYTFFLLLITIWLFIPFHKKNIEVYADYIWKVITYTGDFKIIDKNKQISSKIIKNWDILKISSNSHLTLQVNHWIKLYLIWPAKIQFSKYNWPDKKDIYVINMLDGNYITVKSNSAKDKLIIKSKFINIESNENLVDLKYTKEWNATIIENNWGNIIVKNNQKVLTLSNKEKAIFLENKDIQHIKNIFNDNYKKYQISQNWQIKVVITSDETKRLSNIISRNATILAVWKYVLWSLNNDNKWKQSWQSQLINILLNTYNILNLQVPNLLKNKIKSNDIKPEDLVNLTDYLISNINQKYIIPQQYLQRLKVILAYLVIVEKLKVNKQQKFKNLSSLINYLRLPAKYKKILLTF